MNRALTHLRTRRFISTTSPFSYKVPPGRTGAEGRGGGARYRSISFLAIPFIVGLSVLFVVYKKEPKRTPFVQYEYLRRRAKRFPWGDGTKSLFHNPKYNALPTGYEYELEDEETLEECDETQPPPSGSNPPAAPTG